VAKSQRSGKGMSPQEAYVRGGRFLHKDRYALVFVLILLTILSSAVMRDGTIGLLATLFLQTITLFVTLRTSEAGPRMRRVAEITAVAVLLGVGAVIVSGNIGPARLAYGFSMIVLVAFTPMVIARRLVSHPTININTVTGAADIYLLFGLFFAVVYGFAGEIIGHGTMPAVQAFFIASRPLTSNDFIYYSFVTLTTTGYGDIVAATSMGRMLSITEALIGQLYLVTVVALLVANIGRQRRRPPLVDDVTPEGRLDDSAENTD